VSGEKDQNVFHNIYIKKFVASLLDRFIYAIMHVGVALVNKRQTNSGGSVSTASQMITLCVCLPKLCERGLRRSYHINGALTVSTGYSALTRWRKQMASRRAADCDPGQFNQCWTLRMSLSLTRVVRILHQKNWKFCARILQILCTIFVNSAHFFKPIFSLYNYQWHSYTTMFATLVYVLSRSFAQCAFLFFFKYFLLLFCTAGQQKPLSFLAPINNRSYWMHKICYNLKL